MKAEADGINEILTKQADGFDKLVKSAGSSEKAVQLMIADKLPELIKIQVEAIKNVKIDKVTVWDSGNGSNKDGETSTAGYVKGLLGMVPPLKEMFAQAGAEMPSFLQGDGEKAKFAQVGETKGKLDAKKILLGEKSRIK
jgi:flotillin